MSLFGKDYTTELLEVLRSENRRLVAENDRLGQEIVRLSGELAALPRVPIPQFDIPPHPADLPAGIENAIRHKFAFSPGGAALTRTAIAQQLRITNDPEKVIVMIQELGEVVE